VGGKIGTAEMAKKRGHFQLQSFARIHLTKNLYTTIAEFLILKKHYKNITTKIFFYVHERLVAYFFKKRPRKFHRVFTGRKT
jgi:hypothetical protein